jgi:NAD-dependent DNA ligase
MKCPKCGSEMIKRKSLGVYSCTNGRCYNNESIEDMEFNSPLAKSVVEFAQNVVDTYQQRLDNVLKHFEDVIALKKYVVNQYLEITYWNNEFHLSNPIGNVEISLDTVESLLKDLGVMK